MWSQVLRGGFVRRLGGAAFSSAASAKPYRILGLQQIAIGGLDKNKLATLWRNYFGLCLEKSFVSEKENVDEDVLVLGKGPFPIEVDIMQPVDPNKSPKVHVPALNHVGLWVDDLPKAVEYLKGEGMRFAGGIRPGASGHDVAFIHPVGNDEFPLCGEGVLIELVQAPESVVETYDKLP